MRRKCFVLALALLVILYVSVAPLFAAPNVTVTFDKSCYSPGESGRATVALENRNTTDVWLISASMNMTGLGIFRADMSPLLAKNTSPNPYAYLLASNSTATLDMQLSVPANATPGEHAYTLTIATGRNTPGMMTPPAPDTPIVEQGRMQVCGSIGSLPLTPGTSTLLIAAVGGIIVVAVVAFVLLRRRKTRLPPVKN